MIQCILHIYPHHLRLTANTDRKISASDVMLFRSYRKVINTLALSMGTAGESGLLCFFFVLMMMPGADGRVDEATKEEDKADKQYDTGHATVKSMSFS